MNKFVIAGVVAAVLVVGGILVVFGQNNKSDNNAQQTNTSEQTSKQKAIKACDVITLEDAKTLIGNNATLLPQVGESNLASNQAVTVDNCSYSADGATLGDMMQLVLQVQTGPNDQIKQAYEAYKKEYPGESVSGLGDEAYYSTDNQQTVVLKGEHWFFVGVASINSSKEQNKEKSAKAAEIVLKRL